MKEILQRIRIRWIVLALILIFIWSVMLIPGMGEWYARSVYPGISFLLSCCSVIFSFSLGDCFVYGSIIGLVIYLIYTLVRRRHVKRSLWRTAEYLVWVYAWFYLAWGLNYFRDNFFKRNNMAFVSYSEEAFKSFLDEYTKSINTYYVPIEQIDTTDMAYEIRKGYRAIADRYKIVSPTEYLRPKPMLIPALMSSVGVLGYINPFFIEANLNRDLLPVQLPSTYAHEMAHVLGVSGEAEANLYSYLVCTGSENPQLRFAGYFSIFSYVVGNVYTLLGKEEFEKWTQTLRPEVKELYNTKNAHWDSLYSPTIGSIQDKIYNLYLKGNKIPSGTANYSEVIALLMALDQYMASSEVK